MLQKIPSVPKEVTRRTMQFNASRYSEERSVFPWTNYHVGRYVKAMLGAYAESRNPNLHMDGNFKDYGLGRQELFEWACRIMPWLPEWFSRSASRELTPNTLYDRLHKQYYKDGRYYRTAEHYQVDKKLRPYITAVERAVFADKPVKQPVDMGAK